MKKGILTGLGFGLTSGVIATLGLIVGLFSAIHSRTVVIGGILIIAIADSLSDALGIHISKEFEKNSTKHIWTATFSTFLSKLILALSFLIPFLLFELKTAIIVSIVYGLLILIILSWYIAKRNKDNKIIVIVEHLLIAIAVIIITYYLGKFVSIYFK